MRTFKAIMSAVFFLAGVQAFGGAIEPASPDYYGEGSVIFGLDEFGFVKSELDENGLMIGAHPTKYVTQFVNASVAIVYETKNFVTGQREDEPCGVLMVSPSVLTAYGCNDLAGDYLVN